MLPENRKLQMQDKDPSFQPNTTFRNSNSTLPPPFHKATTEPSPPSPPPLQQQQYVNEPFDSSMALTVLVLLTALFFMGFLSIYMRRFSIDPPDEFPSHRRRFRHPQPPAATSNLPSMAIASTRRGLDPEIVKSLPVYRYYGGDEKYQVECAICLGEFEEREILKVIPNCEHVFHLECLDTWLKMQMSCPVCRGTQFFYGKRDGSDLSLRVGRGTVSDDHNVSDEMDGRSTVENGHTVIEVSEVGPMGVRRTISCSNLGEGMLVERSSNTNSRL